MERRGSIVSSALANLTPQEAAEGIAKIEELVKSLS
jgi:hypothetical protein